MTPRGADSRPRRRSRSAARLPLIGTSRVSIGIVIALIATVVVWLLLTKTTWGFRLGVVGGNPEAARRAGYQVSLLLLGAIAVGGALAGLGGFVQLAGVEFKLRQGFLVGYGYIGFLASWLARHQPLKVAVASLRAGGDRGRAATASRSTRASRQRP